MSLELVAEGADTTASDLSDLRDWITRARIEGVVNVTATHRQLKPEEMGAELTLLTVVLSAPAVTILTQSVQEWLRTRVKKISVVIKHAERRAIITAENFDEQAIREIIRAMKD